MDQLPFMVIEIHQAFCQLKLYFNLSQTAFTKYSKCCKIENERHRCVHFITCNKLE